MKIRVIGAGSWGTTVAMLLAERGHDVTLWARDAERAQRMQQDRENERYLPSFRFPDNLVVSHEAAGDADVLVGAVPTQHTRTILTSLRDALPRAPFVSLSKGFEIGTGKTPTSIFADVMGADLPTAVLTGPCIAREVARGLPTAVVIAGDEADLLQDAFATDRFRVYTSRDRTGAEIAAALKNVLGIASGIVDGMELGDNAKASLLTRGIVEIARLGHALGATPDTFFGLAGFGDLFTTCVSPHGRNRTLGERIGRGETLAEVLASTNSVSEGVPTTKAIVALAREHGVEMPIANAMYSILFDDTPIATALGALMTRERRAEAELSGR